MAYKIAAQAERSFVEGDTQLNSSAWDRGDITFIHTLLVRVRLSSSLQACREKTVFLERENGKVKS
jgi:hypothetical protein